MAATTVRITITNDETGSIETLGCHGADLYDAVAHTIEQLQELTPPV